MRKKFALFAVFFAIITAFYILWPFGRKTFKITHPFSVGITDNGNHFAVLTSAANVSEFLAEKNIPLGEKDFVFPAPEAKIFPGSRIIIRRAVPVTIEADEEIKKADILGTTVRDAVAEAEITLSHADKITPELDAALSQNMNIKITRINFEEITIEEDIPFQTIEKEDKTVLWRKHETKQKGEKGIREKIYKITYTNGKETNRQLMAARIAKPPTNQIEVVGTKIVVGKTQSGNATWYANGDEMTCASLDFAFGKYLRVTNRTNGKSVIVKVNDSGPYGKDRVIDLNKPAFKKIADLGAGVISVKVEEILN